MEGSPTIRAARPEDLAEIVALLADDDLGRGRERFANGDLLPATYLEAFARIDRDDRNELVVMEEAGRVVAALQLTFVPSLTHQGGERDQVEGVRVASGHRGAGRALLGWVVDRAKERGCRMVQLTTDKRRPDARRFYESLGFETTHEGMKLPLR